MSIPINYELKSKLEAVQRQTPSVPSITPETFHMSKVVRPMRNIKHVPTKQLLFYSKKKEPEFNYDVQFQVPLKNITALKILMTPNETGSARTDSKLMVITVKAAGLNPVDLQIINSYNWEMNSFRGIGREYAGVVAHLGVDYKGPFKVGDEVCGLYWHPNSYGTLSSSIKIDPAVDPLVLKPANLTWEEAGSWMVTFGTAWQLLQKAKVKSQSSVLIHGGSSSVGLMALQILKQYYKVENVVAVCSTESAELVKKYGATVTVDYTQKSDLPKALAVLTTTGVYNELSASGEPTEVRIPANKFDLIIDCVGGYDLLYQCNDYLKSSSNGGKYFSIVGDKKFDHKSDQFYGWSNPLIGTRSILGGLWGVNYTKFYFYPFNNVSSVGDWMSTGADLLESGEIVNVIDSVYDWKKFKQAKGRLERGHAHGKVVLQIEEF